MVVGKRLQKRANVKEKDDAGQQLLISETRWKSLDKKEQDRLQPKMGRPSDEPKPRGKRQEGARADKATRDEVKNAIQ